MDAQKATTSDVPVSPHTGSFAPRRRLLVILVTFVATLFAFGRPKSMASSRPSDIPAAAPGCPQVASLYPFLHAPLDAELDELYASPLFKLDAYERLGKAVRIPFVLRSGNPLEF